MSTAPTQSFLDFAADHPSVFIGPLVIGVVVQAFVGGIVLTQSLRFWSRSASQHVLVKAIVAFVSLVAAYVQHWAIP